MELNNIEVEYELVEWNTKNNYKDYNFFETTYLKICFIIIYIRVFYKNIFSLKLKNQIMKAKAVKLINFHLLVDITEETKIDKIKIARHIFYYLMSRRGFSKSELGRELKQSHATVIHAIKTIENDMVYDKKLALNIELINACFDNNGIKKSKN